MYSANKQDPFARIFLLLAVILLALILFTQLWPSFRAYLAAADAQPRAITPRGKLGESEQNTIEIFNQSRVSVVFITTSHQVMDPWTRNVFEVPRGTGSGFVWDKAGHIVTNFHVIKGAESAQVRLNDKRAYPAILVGASPDHDLAVLRINIPFSSPPPLNIGTSDDLQVGQHVYAIGNPFGLDYTLTTGVISALDRTLQENDGQAIHHLVQTDAAINPGNSGGPLLDSAGRLIGVNTAIYSPSGAYAGIGFAVPVDTVNRVVPELIAKGRYIRPGLGIIIDQEINDSLSAQFNIKGVIVLRVEANSTAARAGLRGTRTRLDGSLDFGDVIVAIDGRKITTVTELRSVISDHDVGDNVTLNILRNGKTMQVSVVLDALRN